MSVRRYLVKILLGAAVILMIGLAGIGSGVATPVSDDSDGQVSDEESERLSVRVSEQGTVVVSPCLEASDRSAPGVERPYSTTVVYDVSLNGATSSAGSSMTGTITSVLDDIPLPFVLTLGAYSRFDNTDPLDHPFRAQLHELVRNEPGVTLAQLTQRLDVSESTVRYHTRILEEESHAERMKLWGNVRVFPSAFEHKERVITAALDEETTRTVLEAVATHEPASLTTVAEAVDRAPSTVSHHLSRLDTAGLVDRERDGQAVETTLDPDVRRVLHAKRLSPDGFPRLRNT